MVRKHQMEERKADCQLIHFQEYSINGLTDEKKFLDDAAVLGFLGIGASEHYIDVVMGWLQIGGNGMITIRNGKGFDAWQKI